MSENTPITYREDCTRITFRVWGRDKDGSPWANSDTMFVTDQVMRRDERYVTEAARQMEHRIEQSFRDKGIVITRTEREHQRCDCREASIGTPPRR